MKIAKMVKSFLFYMKNKVQYGSRIQLSLINSLSGRIKIDISEKSEVKIGKFLMARGPLYLTSFDGGNIKIGDNVFFNHNCSVASREKIEIGDRSIFGNNVVIVDHNHVDSLNENNSYNSKKVKIGKNVWVGANCTIVAGVSIDDGAVIAANSIVNKNVGKNEIWGGCPAKFIKRNGGEK